MVRPAHCQCPRQGYNRFSIPPPASAAPPTRRRCHLNIQVSAFFQQRALGEITILLRKLRPARDGLRARLLPCFYWGGGLMKICRGASPSAFHGEFFFEGSSAFPETMSLPYSDELCPIFLLAKLKYNISLPVALQLFFGGTSRCTAPETVGGGTFRGGLTFFSLREKRGDR